MFSGVFTMNERCEVCGHRFMREEGFFQGAMYVSYGLGVMEFTVFALLATLFLAPHTGIGLALLSAAAVHLTLVPWLFRLSRVIWAHINVGTRTPNEEWQG
jgi:hypothetical protein